MALELASAYLSTTWGGGRETYNAVQTFVEVCSAASEDGRRNHGNDSFWIENARRLLRHALDLLVAAEVQPSMDRIMAILHGRPCVPHRASCNGRKGRCSMNSSHGQSKAAMPSAMGSTCA